MKKPAAILLLIASATMPHLVAGADQAALDAEAKAAIKQLAGTLKNELQAAMKAGGPVAALGICHERAPALTAAVSDQRGLTIRRVSLKNRNPDIGKPDAWQAIVLEEFEQRKNAGEAPGELIYSAIDGNEYRFMKAIPTAQVCLNCHGSSLAPDVAAKLEALYPNDRATGFEVGDLRGAFVVTKTLKD